MPRRSHRCRNDSLGRYFARITPEPDVKIPSEPAARLGELSDRLRQIIERAKEEKK